MRLPKALEEKKMDVRLVDKMLHEGRLENKDLKSYFEKLPDDAANATTIEEAKQKQNSNS